MKRFIFNCLLFLGIAGVLVGLFHLVLVRQESKFFRLENNIRSVFLGNSTFEYGIDDSRILHSKNFAQNAEPIDLIYSKLKLLKRFNPQLDTAFIELDDVVLYNEKMPAVLSHPFLLGSFDIQDWKVNINNMTLERNCSYFLHMYDIIKIRPLLKAMMMDVSIVDLGIGGYDDLFRNKLEEDIHHIKQQGSHVLSQKTIPSQNQYYYSKLVKWCEENNVVPVFLNNPMHYTTWSDTVYREFYTKNYSHIPLLDNFQQSLPDSCFADRAHLNYKGARIYSDMLNKQIQSLHSGQR